MIMENLALDENAGYYQHVLGDGPRSVFEGLLILILIVYAAASSRLALVQRGCYLPHGCMLCEIRVIHLVVV